MSTAVMTQETNGNGRRWYDLSTKMIWSLCGVIISLLSVGYLVIWTMATNAQTANASQDVKIERLQVILDSVDKRQERMEIKQDKMDEKITEILRKVQ